MQQDKVIVESPEMSINGNIVKFNDFIISISNVSMVEIGPIPKKKYPIWCVIFILAGLLVFSAFPYSSIAIVCSIIMIIISGIVLYSIYTENKEDKKYLILNLNSGENIFFVCKDNSFLQAAKNAFEQIFQHANSMKTYNIDFKNCNITSQEGDNNSATYYNR